MRTRILLLIVIILSIYPACEMYAQYPVTGNQYNNGMYDPNNPFADENGLANDSTPKVNAESIPVHVEMWKIIDQLGNTKPIDVDTTTYYYYNTCLTEGLRNNYNYLGNLGSPRMSRYFPEQSSDNEFIFITPYSAFYQPVGSVRFVDTKSPYTNLDYYRGGNKHEGEERFKTYFGVNATKRLSFGFNVDYLYGRGLYSKQSTSHINGGVFGSYRGDKYDMSVVFNYFRIKMRENGGISDDRYITNPLSMNEGKNQYSSSDIPVNFGNINMWNTNKDYYVFLNHKYKLGFKRFLRNDTTQEGRVKKVEEFVPVTSFIHTVKFEKARRNFLSYGTPEDYFSNNYMPGSSDTIDDNTGYMSVKNIVGVELMEGFNKWAKMGITAYASYEYEQFTLIDSIAGGQSRFFDRKYGRHDFAVGGQISKKQGELLHYAVDGQISLLGDKIGDFNVNGNLDLNFKLFKDTLSFMAKAYIKNQSPLFYFDRYHSKHVWWDNDMSNEFRTKVEGQIVSRKWMTNLSCGVENIKNYTYFDSKALAAQYGKNIQVFYARLRQDFKLGILHLDNEISYQKSSNGEVLPLPELTLYHNLYISTSLAKKVLKLEIGGDVRYFTKYRALDYSPEIGQYHLQESNGIDIGGYPVINVYANISLKRTRIFAMIYHVNQGMGNNNAFYAPHYPINPRLFKFGVSWNFYD